MLKTTTLMSKYKSTGKQPIFDAEIAIGVPSGIGTEEARQLDRLRGLPQSAGVGDGEPQHQEQYRSEAVRCGDDVQSDGAITIFQPKHAPLRTFAGNNKTGEAVKVGSPSQPDIYDYQCEIVISLRYEKMFD